ncbi:NAD-dependent epimerase/dehydratase family protein [Candidatus Bipolaricaulota bacterium]|nr:NAD-dependent epimerase/dehydratase family protein [Candidatus Bipolaricaulota bacterium]
MPEKYLVTGASGFLGYHASKDLIEKGKVVNGLDIHKFNYPDMGEDFHFYQGDIRNERPLMESLEGVDVVVHSAAALPRWSEEEIFSTNVGGTDFLLEKAFQQGVDRVIYISSTSVYGIPETHPVDEDYPLNGVGPYGTSKVEAEKVCRKYRDRGYLVPVLRPKTFAGPYRLGVFSILNDWVESRKNIPVIGDGENKYQLLHVQDLVDAINLAATQPENKVNDTFNVGATQFRTLKEDLQELLDYAGYGKRVIPIPSWLVIPGLTLLEKLNLSPLYKWVYATADVDHYVSVEKIRQTLGWEPEYSTGEVWTDSYRWYTEEYDSSNEKIGTTHRTSWAQGALSLAKFFF